MDLSIITLTYDNRHIQLQNCIESVLKFTKNIEFEHIIVDNASGAETRRILGRYCSIHGLNLIWIQNKENTGTSARNLGLDIAKGKWIAIVDDDVIIIDPNWATKMLDFMAEDTFMVGPSGSNFVGWDKNIFGPQNHKPGDYVDFLTSYHVVFRNIPKYRFDPNLFSLRDDSDFGLQAKLDNWRLRVSPLCCIHDSVRDYNLGKLTFDKDTQYFINKWKPLIDSNKVRIEGKKEV